MGIKKSFFWGGLVSSQTFRSRRNSQLSSENTCVLCIYFMCWIYLVLVLWMYSALNLSPATVGKVKLAIIFSFCTTITFEWNREFLFAPHLSWKWSFRNAYLHGLTSCCCWNCAIFFQNTKTEFLEKWLLHFLNEYYYKVTCFHSLFLIFAVFLRLLLCVSRFDEIISWII